jgi:hypothetical protein
MPGRDERALMGDGAQGIVINEQEAWHGVLLGLRVRPPNTTNAERAGAG